MKRDNFPNEFDEAKPRRLTLIPTKERYPLLPTSSDLEYEI